MQILLHSNNCSIQLQRLPALNKCDRNPDSHYILLNTKKYCKPLSYRRPDYLFVTSAALVRKTQLIVLYIFRAKLLI